MSCSGLFDAACARVEGGHRDFTSRADEKYPSIEEIKAGRELVRTQLQVHKDIFFQKIN